MRAIPRLPTLAAAIVLATLTECRQAGRYQLAEGTKDKFGNASAWRLDTATGQVCYYIGNSNGVSPFGCWPLDSN